METPSVRYRKRVPCEVQLAGSRRSGMVLNLSESGVFVQTTAAPSPGEAVDLGLNATARDGRAIPVRARVVWNRVVNPQLRSVAQGGFGAVIETAAPDYYSFLEEIVQARGDRPPAEAKRARRDRPPVGAKQARGDRPPVGAKQARGDRPSVGARKAWPADRTRYRVRVKLAASPRSRVVTVTAANEEEASRRALDIAGSGWSLLEPPVRDA